MAAIMVHHLLRSLGLCLTLALVGCGKPATMPPPPAATALTPSTNPAVPAGPAKIVLDVELEKAGITVTEKSRQGKKLLLLIGSPQQDIESSNFAFVLQDDAGKELSKTGLSMPKLGKGESFEWELDDEQLPKAARVVIQPLAKKDGK